jgi:hypothetical protein
MESVDGEVFAVDCGSRMERVARPMVALFLCLSVGVVPEPEGGRLGEY